MSTSKDPGASGPWIRLEVVAEIYEVRVLWIREVYEYGLLGPGIEEGSTVKIAATQLDRVAQVVRLHGTLGLGLESMALALGLQPDDSSP